MAQVINCRHKLRELMVKLDQSGHTGFKLPLVGTIRSVLSDLWAYEAVVDKWPDYSNVILRPNEEEAKKFNFIHKNIYCYGDSESSFKQFIERPGVIPWNKKLFFHACPIHLIDAVEYVAEKNGGKLENRHGVNFYTIWQSCEQLKQTVEKAEHALKKLKLPEGYTVGSLRPEHAELLINEWTYGKVYYPDPEDRLSWIDYIASCIRHNISSCVYNQHGEPVSWSITHHYGSGGMGNTRPAYQNQNIFHFSAVRLARELLMQMSDNFGYTAFDNLGGQKVSAYFGMERVGIGGHRFYSPPMCEVPSKL